MANLSADSKPNGLNGITRRPRRSYVVANTVQLFAGALVGINAAGFLAKWADTAGHKFIGVLLAGVTGDTGATPPVEGSVNTNGLVFDSVTVASLTQADVNALVYCATDNPADFALTASSNVKAVGWVSRFISSGVGQVTLFTPEEHWMLN